MVSLFFVALKKQFQRKTWFPGFVSAIIFDRSGDIDPTFGRFFWERIEGDYS